MSRPRSDALGLGLSRQHLALQADADALAPRDQALGADATAVGGGQALQAALAQLWQAHAAGGKPLRAGQVVVVVLALDLARHWLVQAPAGAATLAEIQAVAQARFEAVHGSPAAGWRIAGDWRSSGSFLCAALPRSLADVLLASCAAQGLRAQLGTTLGCALQLHAAGLPDDGFSVLRTPEHGILLGARRGQPSLFKSWRTWPTDDPAGQGQAHGPGPWQQASDELQREQLRRGEAMPTQVTTLDLAALQGYPAPAQADGLALHRLEARLPTALQPRIPASRSEVGMPALAAGPVAEARLAARLGTWAGPGFGF